MNGRFLLDTNIIIALFRGEPVILQRLQEAAATFVPTVALGGLYYGARKSGHVELNLARLEESADGSDVLVCDPGTARHYGEIKNRLRQVGRPIPENDIWIAALASQHGLTVASRDEHFGSIEGLPIDAW